MTEKIILSLSNPTSTVIVPFSTKDTIELSIKLSGEQYTLGVSNFPSFIKPPLSESLVSVRDDISLNVLSQRLIVDTDMLLVDDIDTMTLGELDIGQNTTYYST